MHVFRGRLTVVAVVALMFGGVCAALAESASAPAIDGIRCDAAEGAVFHIHQHVAVYDHGKAVAIPDDVGRPGSGDCLYWMHTHTPDGLVHVESPVFRTFTLGNFFDIWGQPLRATAIAQATVKRGDVRVYVDGRPYRGNPRSIEMTLHADIVLEAGRPYVKPTPFTDWQGQ